MWFLAAAECSAVSPFLLARVTPSRYYYYCALHAQNLNSLGLVVDVGAMLEQQLGDLYIVHLRSKVKRRLLLPAQRVTLPATEQQGISARISHALGVGIGSLAQQQRRHFNVVPERRGVQGSPSVPVPVRRCTAHNTAARHLRAQPSCSLFGVRDVSAVLEQQLRHLDVVLLRGDVQRCSPVPGEGRERGAQT